MVQESEIFECQQCGHCCQGQTTVSLDPADMARMLAVLGIRRETAEEKYWRVTGAVVQMKTPGGHCVFFDRGCTVHSGKPWRCAQWPLHPSILVDEANLSAIRESCPGINRNLSYEEFKIKLAAYLAGQ
ncbi:MAG: Fe-S oxidoreductase [Deltaproteobacteria bacterium RIFOXYD12_FULL_57_12]|nr:MAG: Fe-S oxidoreductase [Deltaproteobacteria bacterium RIFOXYD12_FULL_57_12]